MHTPKTPEPMAPALKKRSPLGAVLHKSGRLVRRFFTGDVIRQRARRIRPLPGAAIPAYAVAYNEHGGYCVPLDAAHRPVARAIMGGRVWERATLDLVVVNLGDGDVIHAGAFFGDALPFLARRIAPSALVWSFEPNLMNYKAAALTVALNDLGNVRLENAGLGAEARGARLAVADRRGLALAGASFVADQGADGHDTEEIRLVTLDQAIPEDRRIAVIHLDVEGYEEEALKGAARILGRDRPLLILETAPEGGWLTETLSRLGYGAEPGVDGNAVWRAS